ncbi:hypothetical protein EV426DRAFT_26228 [Tirmania nivea]|nr:hypothetical protein EV426DRAFT_26228 [Tirmania nivea]
MKPFVRRGRKMKGGVLHSCLLSSYCYEQGLAICFILKYSSPLSSIPPFNGISFFHLPLSPFHGSFMLYFLGRIELPHANLTKPPTKTMLPWALHHHFLVAPARKKGQRFSILE